MFSFLKMGEEIEEFLQIFSEPSKDKINSLAKLEPQLCMPPDASAQPEGSSEAHNEGFWMF